MKSFIVVIALVVQPLLSFAAENGLTTVQSGFSVKETINRLETLLKVKGVTLFARIDHQAEAAKVGLTMKASQLLIFGNPKIGTALMKTSPTTGIDLPQKALAWEDSDGKVWLSYNNSDFFKKRHGVDDIQLKPFVALGVLIEKGAK